MHAVGQRLDQGADPDIEFVRQAPQIGRRGTHQVGERAVEVDADERAFEALWSIGDAPAPDEVQHRIGGYPNEIQPARLAVECEHLSRGLPPPLWNDRIRPDVEQSSQDWRLLLQIDSDPDLKMNFGDAGRLYVFIRETDARARDFSRTVARWQTY